MAQHFRVTQRQLQEAHRDSQRLRLAQEAGYNSLPTPTKWHTRHASGVNASFEAHCSAWLQIGVKFEYQVASQKSVLLPAGGRRSLTQKKHRNAVETLTTCDVSARFSCKSRSSFIGAPQPHVPACEGQRSPRRCSPRTRSPHTDAKSQHV